MKYDTCGQKCYLGVFRIKTPPSNPEQCIFLFGEWGGGGDLQAKLLLISYMNALREKTTQHRLPHTTL